MADRVIDIDAIQRVYGGSVQDRKHAWNNEIPDICDYAQDSTTSNEFRIKLKLTDEEKNQIRGAFPQVTFAWILFGRVSASGVDTE